MLVTSDLRGLYAIIPTPAKPGADRVDATDTVDLAETERLVESIIRDGAHGLIALGTTGEMATLSAAEFEQFTACVLEVVGRRIPTFIGATSLGGHDIAGRLRFLRDHGADGTLLGLPMWQPLSTPAAIRFYREISEAFPDLAVMVYANQRAFRYDFPLEFWSAVAVEAPTVVAAKYSRPRDLTALLTATGGQIKIIPNESTASRFFATSPEPVTAIWATAASMGPAPVVALMDAIAAGDAQRVETVTAEIREVNAPVAPIFGDPNLFAMYNIQMEKARINAAGYCDCGPCRSPYGDLPSEYEQAARECGKRWRVLHERYATTGVSER